MRNYIISTCNFGENFVLTEEKKKRGRPRIYKDDAEKHRAFRQKRKEEIKKLEEKVAQLEQSVKSDYPWFDWTMTDLAEMSIKDLQDFRKELRKASKVSIYSPIKVIIDDFIKNSKSSKKTLSQDIIENSNRFSEELVHTTIAYLIELELSTRDIDSEYDYEIDLAERRITELEEEIEHKKKIKKTTQ